MKKIWCAVLALMMILTVLCAGCEKDGGSGDSQSADLPTVTAPPASGGNGLPVGLTADDNHAPAGMTREEWLATLSEEQRKAEELVGHTVEELYEAVGEPKSAVYTASCLVEGGEDGILTYDGFFVSTTKTPNGIEYVMGTESE